MFSFRKLAERDWYWRKYHRMVSVLSSESTLKQVERMHLIRSRYRTLTGKELILNKAFLGRLMNFNDKLVWLSLYWQNPLKTICTDKYEVRSFITDTCCLPERILVPLLGVWNDANEIDYQSLPEQFVLKCNHGCGYNIICTDKSALDYIDANEKLNKWLSMVYDKNPLQPHYLGIAPHLILCEEFLPSNEGSSSVIDYKIHCLNGTPLFVLVCYDRTEDGTPQLASFDFSWKQLFYVINEPELSFKKPVSLDIMIEYSRKISSYFPFVRVDFYEINGRPFIGELTFTPCGNMIDYFTPDVLKMLGRTLKLPKKYIA